MIYKFLYKTPNGKTREDISIEAPDRESAIASFEEEFPKCKYWKITKLK